MTDEIQMGTNTEGYLCVWDGKGVMHYFSAVSKECDEPSQSELNQAKIFTLLLKIYDKLENKAGSK